MTINDLKLCYNQLSKRLPPPQEHHEINHFSLLKTPPIFKSWYVAIFYTYKCIKLPFSYLVSDTEVEKLYPIALHPNNYVDIIFIKKKERKKTK